MDLPGMRYRLLATRYRQSAKRAPSLGSSAALLKMAVAYDRKAAVIEDDWGCGSRKIAVSCEKAQT